MDRACGERAPISDSTTLRSIGSPHWFPYPPAASVCAQCKVPFRGNIHVNANQLPDHVHFLVFALFPARPCAGQPDRDRPHVPVLGGGWLRDRLAPIHLGHLALHRARRLLTIEATAVVPDGRITYGVPGSMTMPASSAWARCWKACGAGRTSRSRCSLPMPGARPPPQVPWKGGKQIAPGGRMAGRPCRPSDAAVPGQRCGADARWTATA